MKYPIYLDNNATTRVDPRVMAAMLPVFETHYGNPASTSHEYGWYAAELVQIARERVAQAIGAAAPDLIFTSGATESINLAIQGVIRQARKQHHGVRPHVITAGTEHRATVDTLYTLNAALEIELSFLPVDSTGMIAVADLERALRPNTVLVSLMLANNEMGAIHPIADFAGAVRRRGVLVHCDAAQALGKVPIDVEKLEVDLLSLSGHKCYGPKGIGALYRRGSTCNGALQPLVHGGGHEQGLRSGTLNVPGIVGFGRAAELAAAECAELAIRLRHHSAALLSHIRAAGAKCELNGPAIDERLPGNVNLYFPGAASAKLLPALQGKVACSASSACSTASGLLSHVLQTMKFSEERIGASIRLGIGRFTTEPEIEAAGTAIGNAAASLQQ